MGTRFQPDWVKDQTLPPNWSLEYRPEAPGNKKWELMRGEGHYRMFQFHEDAILEARKQELADIESGAIAVPPINQPRLCYGAQTSSSQPDCDGPEVQRVRVFKHPEFSGIPFITDWCSECRAEARRQGAELEVLGTVAIVAESELSPAEPPKGLSAKLRHTTMEGTDMYEVLIYDGAEPLMYAGDVTSTAARAKETAIASIQRKILGAEVELHTVAKRIDDYKAMITSIRALDA